MFSASGGLFVLCCVLEPGRIIRTNFSGEMRIAGMSESERKKQKLTASQQKAIQALLTERSIRDAAAVTGIGESTLRRWLDSDQGFAETYKAARERVYESGLAFLQSSIESGVKTLREVCESETAPPQVRVGAAKSLVEMGLKARDQLELAERMKAIEMQLQILKDKGK